MSTTQQPEALQLAHTLSGGKLIDDSTEWADTLHAAAAELRHQHARIADLEAQLSATPAVALPEPEAWLATFRPKGMLSPHSIAGVNLEELKRQVPSDSVFKPLYTHPTEGLDAQTETLRAELADEKEAADNWRRLALQFDNHRMQALGHLKAILHPDSSVDEYKAAELFLKAPPLDGESVLAQRIAELSTTTQAQADAQDTDRWMGIGKAIERACADLPEETEIIVSLEKDAGTVTLIDQDGNEHENFSTDYGFAGVLDEAIDTAIAAQAKKGDTQS